MGRRARSWETGIAVLLAISVGGCNLFGGIDEPREVADKYAAAIAAANGGDCIGAKKLLLGIPNPDDDVLVALGWAYLCIAGATAGNVASSLYKYTNGSSDLTIIGTLARTMLPMDGDKLGAAGEAINVFAQVQNGRRAYLNVALARFVRASAILAMQANNNGSGTLDQTDVSAASCSASAANCAAGCAAGMTDGDVTSFTSEITAASTALGNAAAGDLKALADAIAAGFGGAAQSRCFIFNRTIAP